MSAGVPDELRRLARDLDDAAVVRGYSAHILARLLKAEVCAQLTDRLPAGWPRAEFEATVAEIRRAARAWTSAGGSLHRKSTEAGAPSELMTTNEVAELLCVCDRRVLQLASAGRIAGSKRAGRWAFTRVAVDAYMERRREP